MLTDAGDRTHHPGEAPEAWHGGCIGLGIMEVAITLIVLAVGVMLERGERRAQPVRVRDTRRR